jgi:hypothetical protein
MPDLSVLLAAFLSAAVVVFLLWFAFGTQGNIRRGNEFLRWLQKGLPVLGKRQILARLLVRFNDQPRHLHLSPRRFQHRAHDVDRLLNVLQSRQATGTRGQFERQKLDVDNSGYRSPWPVRMYARSLSSPCSFMVSSLALCQAVTRGDEQSVKRTQVVELLKQSGMSGALLFGASRLKPQLGQTTSVFPGIVCGIDISDTPGSYPMYLNDRLPFCPEKMVCFRLHNGDASCRQRFAIFWIEPVANPHIDRARNYSYVLNCRVPVSRELVVSREP